jgi:hypothetical protein
MSAGSKSYKVINPENEEPVEGQECTFILLQIHQLTGLCLQACGHDRSLKDIIIYNIHSHSHHPFSLSWITK